MNSEEGVSLAKMAVTVLLVVLVIGAVVAIVYAAYSWFTSGSDKLGDQVTSIDKSSYSQYDDAQVSGTDVLSALKAYRESEIAIFICNNNNGGYAATPGATVPAYNYCALSSEFSDVSAAQAGNATVNYGTPTTSATLGEVFWVDSLKWDTATNNVLKNTNFSPTTTNSKTDTFVKQSAKWYANLVYDDSTGDICGIIFRQMN